MNALCGKPDEQARYSSEGTASENGVHAPVAYNGSLCMRSGVPAKGVVLMDVEAVILSQLNALQGEIRRIDRISLCRKQEMRSDIDLLAMVSRSYGQG